MNMADPLVPSVHSAVEDLEFIIEKGGGVFDSSMDHALFMLRNVKIFRLSSKKLGSDPNLQCFLHTFEDFFSGFANYVHTLRLFLCGAATPEQINLDKTPEFFSLGNWESKMDQFYITLLDNSRQSNSLTIDEVEDIFDSVLKNLMLFHTLEWGVGGDILREPMKSLEEPMKFLRNLILFVSTGVHSIAKQDIYAHLEAISIKAAYIIFKCDAERCDEIICREILPKISELTQNIKPTDPQVYKAYIEALSSSKFERRLQDHTDRDMEKEDDLAREFLASLMSNIWEMVELHTQDISTKDQLLELYEEFGSMEIILSQERNNIDLKTKDLIFDVICDSGIFICSLYQKDIKVEDDGLRDLLKSIRHILSEDEEKGAPEPQFNIQIVAPLSFVDYLLEKLMELTSCEVKTDIRRYAQTLKEELILLRSFLGDIVDLRREHEELQATWDGILELVYRAEHLIDYLMVSNLSDSFSTSFDSIMKDMQNIKLNIKLHKPLIKMKGVTMTHCNVSSQKSSSLKNEVVGFLEEANSIKDCLTRGPRKLQCVAIVGMPGQGKTTLATKVYNDPSISLHFSVCAWTIVSQTVDKRRVLLDLLSQIDPNQSCAITSDRDLVEKVWRSLKGRRFLIFLDDIWEAQVLIDLKEAFPDDHMGSRIMLTSRHHDIAPDEEPYKLRPFNDRESMDLLQKKLFGENCWPTEFPNLGTEIIQICKGLPLTILIVAGILANTQPEDWETIFGGLRSHIVSSVEQCWNTLEMSYLHLPEYLRPCLLYFAAFVEDVEVPIQRLLRIWIAEGFIRKSEKKRIEDVAEDYLKELMSRSLVTLAKESSLGGTKTCRIHDLLHEFCLQKVKDEHFFAILGGKNKSSAICARYNVRRLCINFNPKYLTRSSKIFSHSRCVRCNYQVEDLLDLSFMFSMFKLLRVLDLWQINLGSEFPSEIRQLLHLAFLSIRGYMKVIPQWIGNLSQLETFILYQIREDMVLSLPDTFWNLKKLGHLSLTKPGGSFCMENLGSTSDLCELDKLSGVAISYPSNIEGLMKKFPNVRKLKCTLLISPQEIGKDVNFVIPESLRRLESLGVSLPYAPEPRQHRKFEFNLPPNLKKLSLSSMYLCSSSLSTISHLPNLKVLKLNHAKFDGNTWEMEEGEFSKLKILKLSSWDLTSWSAAEDQFDCLEKLELQSCISLKEMPSCLGNISTLEEIKVLYCSNDVRELVRKIQEVQEDNGNSELKIITNVRS